MAFDNVRFPENISYGSSGGPEYSTDIIVMSSGHEQRNINWSQARAKYNITHGVKTQEQLDELIAFFRARKGRARGFKFKDWSDYRAVNELIAIGNGIQHEFQLKKSYSSGQRSEVREIRKPVEGTVYVYLNGKLQKNNKYKIDYNNGVILLPQPLKKGDKLEASFEFDVPVRFDTDRLSASLDSYGLHSWKEISLIEIRGWNGK